MKPAILVSHPFGNANVRQAALAFADADFLAGFRTCINWPEDAPLGRFLPHSILSQLQRRTFPSPVSAKTRTQPLREMGRLAATRLGWNQWMEHETGPFSIDRVTRCLDLKVADELLRSATPANAIYAYEDGASASFAAAKQRQIRCLYDLPIGYWQSSKAIQSEEAERQPEWAATLTAMIDSPEKLARKDAELADADAIFVASQFTARTLTDYSYPAEKIHIIPYGCPVPESEPAPAHDGPLRVLFVGSLGQRKGTSYLLSAIEQLGKHATLTLLGTKPMSHCAPLEKALQKHRWLPSLPHSEVLREMREHDVLVFPSLFEGFGLVITEALSQGIPVITTPNTSGPDLLTEGEDGYIIPIRDEVSIAERLTFLLTHRDHLQSMKAAALEKAKTFTWHKYRTRLVAEVARLLT
ncbi:MAG: glycosyltransferase family 4 protein [Chthoniobacterales bacterium]